MSDWIEHDASGPCPVVDGIRVSVKLASGATLESLKAASAFYWGRNTAIIAYRILDDKPASVSDGSTASYYELPEGATELQDLISHRNMNAQDGEIFRAIYRKGRASHSDELRDARKVLFYAKAEVARLEKLK